MASSNPQPCPRQIVDLDSAEKIISNEEILREILLRPDIKDKKVCVISITGTFRQGKSFLLNFFLRYLTLKCKSQKWLNPDDGNISGFPWKCGSERHTVGIMIWPEVFLAPLPTGEEIAIVLLDTQGTFDNRTNQQQCAGIFAISTLISSVQIYNLKNKINQYDLEHLECFSGYGQLATEENAKSNRTPFQNLCFLIRDWQNNHEINYGSTGGKKFLEKVFNLPEQPVQLKKQNENIQSLFDKITCFLLPHPGQKVAAEPAFQGNLEDVDPDFIKYVEEFVPSILAPENLVPKIINGQEIKVSDLVHYIKNYCEYFTNQEVPQIKSMFRTTAETHLNIISEESEILYARNIDILLNIYEDAIETDELENMHEFQKAEALNFFRNQKSLGNEEMKRLHLAMLEQKLEKKFLEYRKLNAARVHKNSELSVQKQHQAEVLAENLAKLREEWNAKTEEERCALQNNIQSMQQEFEMYQQINENDPHFQSRLAALLEPSSDLPSLEEIYATMNEATRPVVSKNRKWYLENILPGWAYVILQGLLPEKYRKCQKCKGKDEFY